MEELRNSYGSLVRKADGKRPLGTSRREDNFRMDFRELGWENMDWIHLPQDKKRWRVVVNTVMNLRVT
jgi:hypothetical protein